MRRVVPCRTAVVPGTDCKDHLVCGTRPLWRPLTFVEAFLEAFTNERHATFFAPSTVELPSGNSGWWFQVGVNDLGVVAL